MQISKRVILLAKERALFGFSMLAQKMVSEARYDMQRPTQSMKTATDPAAILEASHFLQREGNLFVDRLLTFYGDYLDRAMQTMYRDLRSGLRNVSADRLSLIDDETMNRQIEVDRLVVRMRDVDQENLGRLNLMIAQLHGDHDVRERENPFRPYLLARSMHDVLAGMVKNDAACKLLFDAMSEILLGRLPGFYATIREVFEANGVRSRLLAKPASLTRRQRELLRKREDDPDFDMGEIALVSAEPATTKESKARIQSGLQRMFDMQKTTIPMEEDVAASDARKQAIAFQEFVWQMFNQKRPAPLPRGPVGMGTREAGTPGLQGSDPDAQAATLAAQLLKIQKEAAAKGAGADERNRLNGLREQIDGAKISATERMTVDAIVLLFEFIFQDEQIPLDVRNEIGRLQVPFLRAAMLTPDLLQQPAHPARHLLNRLGAVAAALDLSVAADRGVFKEIGALIGRLMERFEDDMAVFTICLDEFEDYLKSIYRYIDDMAALRVDAIEEAERASVMQFHFESTLHDLLPPLEIDRRVSDFVTRTWSRVMATLMVRYADDDGLINQYRVILPELVWSVQPGHRPQDRNLLMRMLPELVKRLKKGMELARVSEEESRNALDQLADVHMQVLRSTAAPGKKSMTLQELYQHFSFLQVCEGSYLWTESVPLTVRADTVLASLVSRDIEVELHIETEAIPALATDDDWMEQMCLGIGAEVQTGKLHDLVRLAWVSEQRSLFMFVVEESGKPMIYSSISLLKALRDGLLRPLEYAPLFERAVESLMVGAESLQIAV